MPFIRLAIAAALTVALVLPSAASAQAPTQGLAQVDAQIQVLKIGVNTRNGQLAALRTQIAMLRNTVAGSIVAATLQPRIDSLASENQRAQKHIDELNKQRELLRFAADIQKNATLMTGIAHKLDTAKAAGEAGALRAQFDAVKSTTDADMAKLKAMMDKHAATAELLSSMIQQMTKVQDQVMRNLRA